MFGLEGKLPEGRKLFLARLQVIGEDKFSSLLAHFSWRGAFLRLFIPPRGRVMTNVTLDFVW